MFSTTLDTRLKNENRENIFIEIMYEKQHALRAGEWMIMSEETRSENAKVNVQVF